MHRKWTALQERNTEPREPVALWEYVRERALYLRGDTTSSLKVTCYKQTLKNGPDKEQSGPCNLGIPGKIYRSTGDP